MKPGKEINYEVRSHQGDGHRSHWLNQPCAIKWPPAPISQAPTHTINQLINQLGKGRTSSLPPFLLRCDIHLLRGNPRYLLFYQSMILKHIKFAVKANEAHAIRHVSHMPNYVGMVLVTCPFCQSICLSILVWVGFEVAFKILQGREFLHVHEFISKSGKHYAAP